MKVNKGLPFLIILGMSFLSSEKIVIDPDEQMAIDKHSGYDLINPPPLTLRLPSTPWIIPLSMPKRIRTSKPLMLKQTGAPALAGYLLPGPVMAAVRD